MKRPVPPLSVAAFALSLILVGCDWANGGDQTGDGSEGETVALASLLPTVPEHLVGGARSRVVDESAKVAGIYNPILGNFNVLAANALDLVSELVAAVDDNVLTKLDVLTQLMSDGSFSWANGADVTEKGRGSYDPESDLFTFEIWERSAEAAAAGDDDWTKTLHMTMTEVADGDYEGEVWLASRLYPDTRYHAEYDTIDIDADGATTIVVDGVGIDEGGQATEDVPTNISLEVVDGDSAFAINANVYYTSVVYPRDESEAAIQEAMMRVIGAPDGWSAGDDPIAGASYVYRCVSDNATKRIVADLAITPADATEMADIYTTNSVGAVWGEGIAAFVKSFDDLYLINEFVLGDIASYEGGDITAESTAEEILTAISTMKEWSAIDDEGNEGLKEFIENVEFVTALTNPAYFAQPDGADESTVAQFVGTADLSPPDWAGEAPATEAVAFASASVASLVVEIPAPAQPDF